MEEGNSRLFELKGEGHTMGNLLKHRLLEREDVTFAGYKVTGTGISLRIETDGETKPIEAFRGSLKAVMSDMDQIKTAFQSAIVKHKMNSTRIED